MTKKTPSPRNTPLKLREQLVNFLTHAGQQFPKSDYWFLSQYGQPFPRRAHLDPKLISPRSRVCYLNAWNLATFSGRDDLRYAEGYVWYDNLPLPIMHGFCVDRDGNVVDPSIANGQKVAYHGVLFKRATAFRWWWKLRKQDLIGILANAWLLKLTTEELLRGIEVPGELHGSKK